MSLDRSQLVAAYCTIAKVVGASILCFAALELGARIWQSATHPDPQNDVRRHADAYAGADWVDTYFNEYVAASRMVWEPYTYWRRRPFRSQYINVDSLGRRITWSPPEDTSLQTIRIFVFGGSTIWGTGSRDDYTIPSLVSMMLWQEGIRAKVFNYGESGYVSGQELILFSRLLARGQIPDVVVFYDGVNDVYAALQNGTAGVPQNESFRAGQFELLQGRTKGILLAALSRLADRSALVNLVRTVSGTGPDRRRVVEGDPKGGGRTDTDALAAEILRHYTHNVRQAGAIAEAYGVQAFFIWQPVIFGKTRLSRYERARREDVAEMESVFTATYEAVARSVELASEGSFFDASGQFYNTDIPVFLDFCHLSERGNKIIAASIAGYLTPRITTKAIEESG